MGNETSTAAKITKRVLVELLISLPAWLILTLGDDLAGKLAMICTASVFFGIGLVLYKLPPVWSRVILLAAMAIVLIIGIGLLRGNLPNSLWICALLWRGRYPKLTANHYGLAFLICCLAVIIASQNDILSGYRIVFITLAVIWIMIWFISLNSALMKDAGLQNNIVTRPVRLASRKYLLLFLAVALVIFALTVNYGKQLLTLPGYSSSDQKWLDVSDLQTPAPAQPMEEDWRITPDEQRPPSVIWDILFWTMAVAAMLGGIWFARMLWKDRTWSWNRFIKALRTWFLREKKVEALPYVEERRSLLKDKKKGPSRWNALFERRNIGLEWEQLSNPQKVRRIYEEAVLSGIEQGYEFKPHHTPSETLEGIKQWRVTSLQPADKEKANAYWPWFLSIRLSLLKLYEIAKYSTHSVTEQEVGSLKGDPSGGKARKNR
jgi:hypothetical protein